MKGGFRSQELDGCKMTLGFRKVRAARERNTLRPVLCVLYELDDERCRWDEMRSMGPFTEPLWASCHGLQVREDIYSGCYMKSGRLRSLDIRNTYPCLDPDPQRTV